MPYPFIAGQTIMTLVHSSPSSLVSLRELSTVRSIKSQNQQNVSMKIQKTQIPDGFCKRCFCGRRHFLEAAAATGFLPIDPSYASDFGDVLRRVHPPRPDWYEEFYASVMNTTMESYEAEIAGYKAELFGNLVGKAEKVLEIGIGTGPNLKYYAGNHDLQVVGVDPNAKMEKYAREAAVNAGLLPENFSFRRAVGEAIPLEDASMDAVVGTLVLCSVSDVNQTLKEVKRVLKPGGVYLFIEHVAAQDGTLLKYIQSFLDPVQQILADGCHLSRETGKQVMRSGFANTEIFSFMLSDSSSLISPHVYGLAYK